MRYSVRAQPENRRPPKRQFVSGVTILMVSALFVAIRGETRVEFASAARS